eukprot:CAMPEP_0204284876 /NCGR_PEP_ID=MMETSP0468-20130131/49443_1 /ASSEMBLY_ACC=CAM_ASM_000383 /TAXON_ID=2969 /ORGANISM="Oxyrrhis marina" /LENGTH=81 /DNA_ID=CAMNT_0051262647 /DNA_START=36 /DNA_END=278 /DNA_ORIENTATION=+
MRMALGSLKNRATDWATDPGADPTTGLKAGRKVAQRQRPKLKPADRITLRRSPLRNQAQGALRIFGHGRFSASPTGYGDFW